MIAKFLLCLSFIVSLMYGELYTSSFNNQTITSATELDYPPFSVILKDGTPTGFSIELLRATIGRMGGKVSFYVDEWEQVKNDLKERKIQVLPVVGRTEEREQYFDFTIPYLTMHGAVFTRKEDTRIKAKADLMDKEIAVMQGDNAQEYVNQAHIGKKVVALGNYTEAFKALSAGKYDAIVVQKLIGVRLVKKLGLKNIKVSDFILEDFRQDFAFAVAEGDKDLLALLNEGLAITKVDGTYVELYTKWFHDFGEKSVIDERVIWFFVGLSVVLCLIILLFKYWNASLKQKVHEKTLALKELNDSLEKKVEVALDDVKEKEKMLALQSRHAAMGEMISMIAHQWRQPLAVISMIVNNQLLDLELEALEKESLREALYNINMQTKELSATIDDFKDFFRPQKIPEMRLPQTIIDDALRMIGKVLEGNSIQVTVENHATSIIEVYHREMMQVLINILNNAKDVLIEKNPMDNRKIEILLSEDDCQVKWMVCDNGGGIKKELITKIFEPYFSTKMAKNGTGLGLYMSKTIVEQHMQGRIYANNTAVGACFIIEIPKQLREA